jgi:hypothetical protein
MEKLINTEDAQRIMQIRDQLEKERIGYYNRDTALFDLIFVMGVLEEVCRKSTKLSE